MKKYIVIYHATNDFMQQASIMSQEERTKEMDEWMLWARKCGDRLIDMGNPLMNGQELIKGGQSLASKRNVIGYSLLQAENMDEAKSLLYEHPHIKMAADCSIEVHEAMQMPGM